jgi:PKD repeat protein
VQFSDDSEGSITAWQWHFGDSGTSSEADPAHTYLQAGVYTVTLSVEGPSGSDSEVRPHLIRVDPRFEPPGDTHVEITPDIPATLTYTYADSRAVTVAIPSGP